LIRVQAKDFPQLVYNSGIGGNQGYRREQSLADESAHNRFGILLIVRWLVGDERKKEKETHVLV